MIVRVVFLVIIMVQFIANMYLISVIENMEEENKLYFKKLRREYDLRIEELKKDVELRDEILEGRINMYNNLRGKKYE